MAGPALGSWGACPEDRLCQPGGSGLGGCPRRGSGKMSRGTAHLLTALFVVAAMGYPSRRSATDLDATPRTTVTFDGKGVRVLVMVVRFGILPALGLVHHDWVQPSPAPQSGVLAWEGSYREASSPLGSRNQSPHICLALGAWSRCAPRDGAEQRHLPKSWGGQGRAGSHLWLVPSPAQQPLEGVLSRASHLGWAVMAQIVSRELSFMIFSNCHWALGLQPLWCRPAPQCHHALGIHTTLLTSLAKPSSAFDGGRGFHLQLGCPFLPRQCLLLGGSFPPQLPPGSQAPRYFLLVWWEGPSLAWGPSGQG